MSANEDWPRIEELFFACEELDDEAREAFLDETCREDAGVRQRVERLLAAAESVGDRFEGVVARAAAEVDSEGSGKPGEVPDSLGPYRLLGVLGEGGMGTVYLGERADGAYRQQVAIKVIRGDLIGRQVVRRFERERQILAKLRHPAIARLLDGGRTPAGSPYLVMEYVEGEPIDAYCDRHRLSIEARLELVRAVCSAVQAAHRNLIVHRDLKPSNILVAADGKPTLLDFGISKLLSEEPIEGTALTLQGQQLLTPEFASPEQVCDEPITTAVDVYALGLLLHGLLTGDRPYPIPSSRGEALRKAICESPSERPSATITRFVLREPAKGKAIAAARSTDPKRLRRRVAGDLDQIVSKALRKEAGERYGSVQLLSDDLGRHLEGLPVEARRGERRYRAGRFLRRHRTLIAAVLAVVAVLVLGLIGQMREAERANLQAERANREAERANLEARTSTEVANFLIELFDASDPTLNRQDLTARQLLERGVERIHEELSDQPRTQARLLSALGRVHHNRGLFHEAGTLFQAALERLQVERTGHHPDLATAHLDVADNLRVLGQVREAMPHYETALAMRREHFGEDSVEFAQILNNMALARIRTADYDEASKSLERALDVRRRHLGDHVLVAQSLHNLTLIASRLGDYPKALTIGQEALRLKRKTMEVDHPSRGRTLSLVAWALQQSGRYSEAERVLVESLGILRGAWEETHVDVLAAEGDLAFLRHLQGRPKEAVVQQRRILDLKMEHLGEEHREVAHSLDALGRQLADHGEFDEAEALLRRSLTLRSQLYSEDHPGLATGRARLGEFLLRQGRLEEAGPLLRRALTTRRRALPPSHPDLAESLIRMAEVRVEQGFSDQAVPFVEEGLRILRRVFSAEHPRVAEAETILDQAQPGRLPKPDGF